MESVANQMPPWAVYIAIGLLSSLVCLLITLILSWRTKTEQRIEKQEEIISLLKIELGQKASYTYIEKEIEKLSERNHSDNKEIQGLIADSMKTVHGRLDDLHIVLLNLLNGNLVGGKKDQ